MSLLLYGDMAQNRPDTLVSIFIYWLLLYNGTTQTQFLWTCRELAIKGKVARFTDLDNKGRSNFRERVEKNNQIVAIIQLNSIS